MSDKDHSNEVKKGTGANPVAEKNSGVRREQNKNAEHKSKVHVRDFGSKPEEGAAKGGKNKNRRKTSAPPQTPRQQGKGAEMNAASKTGSRAARHDEQNSASGERRASAPKKDKGRSQNRYPQESRERSVSETKEKFNSEKRKARQVIDEGGITVAGRERNDRDTKKQNRKDRDFHERSWAREKNEKHAEEAGKIAAFAEPVQEAATVKETNPVKRKAFSFPRVQKNESKRENIPESAESLRAENLRLEKEIALDIEALASVKL